MYFYLHDVVEELRVRLRLALLGVGIYSVLSGLISAQLTGSGHDQSSEDHSNHHYNLLTDPRVEEII